MSIIRVNDTRPAWVPERFKALVIGSTLAWPDYARSQPWWMKLMMGTITTRPGRCLV